MERVYILEGKR